MVTTKLVVIKGDQGFRGCGFGGDDIDIVVVLEVGWWQCRWLQ